MSEALQSWAFVEMEKVWFWKTPTGYMMFDLGPESFVALFPTAQIAGAVAVAAKLLGHPEPCKTRHIWTAAIKLLDDGLAGYAWIDGESVEIYRVADMPSAALDLLRTRTSEDPNA